VPPKVQTRESVALFVPAEAGLLFTVTVQVAFEPARSAEPQVSAVIVKSVESSSAGAAHPVAAAVPELVRVKTWVEDADPTLTSPKSWVSGVQAKEGSTPVTVI
jgi:hypothetical protein